MTKHPRILFVVADGGRARMVVRSAETGHFVTRAELAAGDARSVDADAAVFQSFGSGRHSTGRPDTAARKFEAEFAEKVADEARARCREYDCSSLVLAAPARFLSALRENLAEGPRVAAELAKDLTKTPDAELGDWLRSLELSAESAG
jgi:protein required for attachment to host cells